MKNKLTTKKIVIGGAVLAIMIISQFLKGISVYITGPIVNACLIIATLAAGPLIGIILSVIAPITSYFISGAPVQVAFAPWLQMAIIFGNLIYVSVTYLLYKTVRNNYSLPLGLILGSILKALFMGAVISNFILEIIPTSLPEKALTIAKSTFSVTQLITALLGSLLSFIIFTIAGRYLKTLAE